MRFLYKFFHPIFLMVLFAAPVRAMDELPQPTGEIILTVTGEITNTNADDAAVFDFAMLEALDPETIETTTFWTEGKQSFTGVRLHDLMKIVGAEGTSLKAVAINDYEVEIPDADWIEEGPIIAFLNNGTPMSVREKGPLWVIYPYDQNPEFRNSATLSRSVWQLDRLIVHN